MRFSANCQIARGNIDPAPMVDVVFLLLIFLVLSSPFVLQSGIGVVVLPSVREAPVASFQGMVVTVTREDLLFFNNQPVKLGELENALRAAAAEPGNQELVIKADKQVPHGVIVRIMDLAIQAGIQAVNMATRTELPGPSAQP